MTSIIYRQMVFFLALVFSGSTYAAGQIDPFVDTLIKQASDYLSMAESFSVRSDSTIEEVTSSGQKIQLSRSGNVLMRRPDRMRAEVLSDQGITRFYYDGKKMSRFDLEKNVYASFDVSGGLDAALDQAMARFQIDAPLADMLAGNLYENVIPNTDSAFYAGLHYLDDDEYHHLALSNENVDFQIWISDGLAPLVRKAVITYKHLRRAPQFTAVFSDWVFNRMAPDMVFDFYPPIDADEIEFLPVATSESGVNE